jgi:hypothetical protein
VIIAQGGAFNGWSLYAQDGKLRYCYNLLGIQLFYADTGEPLPAGQHQVRMEFKYNGRGLAKGGNAALYPDGKKVGEGRVETTVPMMFSGDETLDLGIWRDDFRRVADSPRHSHGEPFGSRSRTGRA